MKAKLCKFAKDVENGGLCPNRDSILRHPLIDGRQCRLFRRGIPNAICPFVQDAATDAEVSAGFEHEPGVMFAVPRGEDAYHKKERRCRRECRCRRH